MRTVILIRRADARASRGFTLVELLVVIGIIALLMAILLPALSRAREQANLVKCLATLRSMHQAAQLHAVEHQGYMPLAGFQNVFISPAALGDADQRKYIYFRDENNPDPKGNDGLTTAPLSAVLGVYMNLNLDFSSRKKLQACLQQESLIRCFSCPSDANPPTRGSSIAGRDHRAGPDELMSYVFNQGVLGRRDQYPDLCPMGKITRICHASEVFLFGDGVRGDDPEHAYGVIDDEDDQSLYDYWARRANPGSFSRLTAQFDYVRHKKKMNVVFVDGHAETIQIPDFKTHGDFDRVGVSRGIYR